MFRSMSFRQGVLASLLLLPLGAGTAWGQDFIFGDFESDVQFNGQYILDQNATGYSGWFDWGYPDPARPTYSPVTPETTLGVTRGTNSMPWRPAGAEYDQGLAVKVQDLPAATRDAFFNGFFNNTHLAMSVTYNNDDWFLAYNGDGWNGNEVTMSVSYTPNGGGNQFVNIGLPDGRPDIDSGNPGEHRGRWDIANYSGVHTRTMMWDYSAIKNEIQTLYNAGNLDEIDGALEFVMSTAHGNFDLGPNAPFTSPAFYVDNWRFTTTGPVQGGLTNYQLPDALTWPGSPVHTTTTTSTNLPVNFNTEATIGIGGGVTHTFTPTQEVKLDGFAIRAAGAPTTGELYLYRNPNGGSEADGFVNNGQNERVIIEAMPYTFFGTDSRTFLMFDLTGGAEVTLEAGVEYSIDLRNTGTGEMYWMRASAEPFLNAYTGGNIYARNPIVEGNEGERFDVSGSGRRDGTLALYAVLPSAGLLGDYNNDGNVDAADYTVWRNNVGNPGNTLLNRDPANGTGVVDQNDYNSWKANFGAGGGGSLASASVPEPACWMLGFTAFVALCVARQRS